MKLTKSVLQAAFTRSLEARGIGLSEGNASTKAVGFGSRIFIDFRSPKSSFRRVWYRRARPRLLTVNDRHRCHRRDAVFHGVARNQQAKLGQSLRACRALARLLYAGPPLNRRQVCQPAR